MTRSDSQKDSMTFLSLHSYWRIVSEILDEVLSKQTPEMDRSREAGKGLARKRCGGKAHVFEKTLSFPLFLL